MRNLLIVVLFLAVAAGVVGYWRGWYSFAKESKVGVESHPTKFTKDREAFSKSVSDKAKSLKQQVESLWAKSDKLSDADKKELADLKIKHDRLEQQIKELDDAGEDKFDGIKQDLSTNLKDVETRIEELSKKVEKQPKDKQGPS
jgi:TolA-binding protein